MRPGGGHGPHRAAGHLPGVPARRAVGRVGGLSSCAPAAGQRSRAWLGVALILGGVGAALAGVSYQAFSYELKCAGLELCRLTNAWEVGYSVTQAFSVSAMLIAVAHACTTGRLRRGLIIFAIVDAVAYAIVTIIGVLMPSAALLSFAVLMLFAVPVDPRRCIISRPGRRYRSTRDPMDRSLVRAAVLLVVVQAPTSPTTPRDPRRRPGRRLACRDHSVCGTTARASTSRRTTSCTSG